MKTSENPTRKKTWSLCKGTMIIFVIRFVFIALDYFAALEGLEKMFHYYVSGVVDEQGNKQHLSPEDVEDMEILYLCLLLGMEAFFAGACCLSICFASCIIGWLYKFHSNAKELEIMQNLPVVSQPQQFPPQVIVVQRDGSSEESEIIPKLDEP